MHKQKTRSRHVVGLLAVTGLLTASQVIGAGPAIGLAASGLALGIALIAFDPKKATARAAA